MPNPHSTAKLAGHPIHPMLIPFPIAFFVSTFLCDLAYWRTGNTIWVEATIWLLGAGILMAALAAAAGLTDVMGDGAIREIRDAWQHAGGNAIIVLIEIYNWFIRYRYGADVVLPQGLILSLIAAGGLLFTGWKGWEMVYRHRVGVAEGAPPAAPTTTQTATPTQAPPRTPRRAA